MSETTALLAETTTRLFADADMPKRLAQAEAGEWPLDLWAEMAGLGLVHAAVPEGLGGSGLARAEAAEIVRIAAGYSVPLPIAETMAAAWVLADHGQPPAEGAMTVATRGVLNLSKSSGGRYRIFGTLPSVAWSEAAAAIVAAAEVDGEPVLLRLEPPYPVSLARRNLADEPRAVLAYSGQLLPAEGIVARNADVETPLLYLAALRAMQLVGAMQHALEIAIDYATLREQFGRPIGRFQAIQHALAAATGHYAAGFASATAAFSGLSDPDPARRLLLIGSAKARCGSAATDVAAVAHQLMGAIGFTREHALHHSTRRLWSWREEAGDEAFWNERLGKLAQRLGATAFWDLLAGVGA